MARLRWLFLLFPLYGAFSSVVQGCGGVTDGRATDSSLSPDDDHDASPYGYYGYGDDR